MGSHSSTARQQGDSPSYLAQAKSSAASAGRFVAANATPEQIAAKTQTAAEILGQAAVVSQGISNIASGLAPRRQNALQAAMEQTGVGSGPPQGTVGGCDCVGGYFGGADEDPARGVREYYESRSAKAKESVIRRLGRALNEAGLNIADPDTAPLDQIVGQLVAQIPNPRAGRTFSSKLADHENVCKVVAKALNAQFTPGATRPEEMFIDATLGPEAVCRAVGEWVHSFAIGVNTEFLDTVASVRNVLHNVRLMDEVMAKAFQQIRDHVDAGECGPEALRNFTALSDLYQRAQSERQRQEELLNNILHANLGPLELELEAAMRDESDRNYLIQKIGLKPGTGEFANTLAMALSGLGTAASIAHRVNKALKTVGSTVDDYLRAADESYLRGLDASVLDFETDKNWAEIVDAMATLRNAFSNRKDKRFAEALREASEGKTGGAGTVDERVKRLTFERKALVEDFSRRLAAAFEEFVAGLKALTPELGAGIPLGPESDTLREAISRLSQREERLELALIGYFADAESREKKENFLQALRHVSAACASLEAAGGRGGATPKLQRVKASVDAIEKLIDSFTGRTSRVSGGADDEFVGGAGSDLIPHLSQSGASLVEAANEFLYFYYISKVRENFARASKELPSYGAKYEDMLGSAIAEKVKGLRAERDEKIANIDNVAYRGANQRFEEAYNQADNRWVKAAKDWVEKEFEAKTRFYRALEAVDLYLKAFTEGVVSDPGAIRDVSKHLEGVKVIARWYNETSGDAIWKAFECMRSIDPVAPNNDVAADGNPLGAAARDANDNSHYYAKLGAAKSAAGAGTSYQVGLPFLGVLPGAVGGDQSQAAKKLISDAYDNYQGLKNLFNAFMRIGMVFGGKDIRQQVFMSPTQLYKSFIDYLKQSALSIHLGAESLAPAVIQMPGLLPGDAAITRMPDSALATPAVGRYFGVRGGHVFFGSVDEGLKGSFADEDLYFTMAVKAIAGKVLTALGVYDMFSRRTPLIERAPARTVLGGAAEPPQPIVGATELYFRLPRLAEFYRCLRWKPDVTDPSSKIAMLPELEGVFSGLIRAIFARLEEPASGDYTESELFDIIYEVNQIWNHYHGKHGEKAVDEAISAFVTEINRRLGVVKRDDMERYWDMLKKAERDPWTIANNTDYMILPGEGEAEADRRAPSDRYQDPEKRKDSTDKTELGPGDRNLLRNFMNAVESDLSAAKTTTPLYSFALMLKQAKTKMQAAPTAKEKLEIAMELIQGSERTTTEKAKALMFNETVVLGLNALNAVERYITLFEEQLARLDLGQIMGYLVDRFQFESLGGVAPGMANKPAMIAHGPVVATASAPAIGAAIIDGRYVLPRDTPPGGVAPTNTLYGRRAGTLDNTTFERTVRDFIVAEAAGARAEFAAPPPARNDRYTLSDTANQPVRASTVMNDTALYDSLAVNQKRYFHGLMLSARLSVDTDYMMVDFIEALYALHHSTGGLIEVKLTATGDVMLGFARLREMAEALMSDVKHYLDALRPYVSADIVQRYESLAEVGSVFWLEKNLFDLRFRGSANENDRGRTMDGISRKATEILRKLKERQRVAVNPATPLARVGGGPGAIGWNGATFALRPVVLTEVDATIAASREEDFYESYGRAFSQLVFYDAGLPNSGLPDGLTAAAPRGIGAFALGTLAAVSIDPRVEFAAPGGGGARIGMRLPLYSSETGMLCNRSLMGAFNQLLAWYLAVLSEATDNHRIYSGLVSGYANGPAARSVMSPIGNSFPDVTTVRFGQRGDPKPNAVLYLSLAYILQRIVTDTDRRTQMPLHLIQTLTDVPAYLKEEYRVALPAFVRLFDLLTQKGDFIKQFFQRTGVRCWRPSQLEIAKTVRGGNVAVPIAVDTVVVTSAGAVNIQNYGNVGAAYHSTSLTAVMTLTGEVSSVDMKVKLSELIDAINAGAYALSSSATEVLKELGDLPTYFQTHEGSIEEYRLRQGKMPLMPLSLAAHALRDHEVTNPGASPYVDSVLLFPKYHKGEAVFKFQYGVRGLLVGHRPVTYEQMPGTKSMIDEYNGFSASREQIDPGRYLAFNQRVVNALRYLAEGRNFKSAISTANYGQGAFNMLSLLGGTGGLRPGLNGNATWALTVGTTEVTGVVDTTNQESAVDNIVRGIIRAPAGVPSDRTSQRKLERATNLVDLNIEPINPSAFMRDIPLANIYNYELAFEKMAAAVYGEDSLQYTDSNSTDYRKYDRINKTRQLFLSLLCNPYMQLDDGANRTYFTQMTLDSDNAAAAAAGGGAAAAIAAGLAAAKLISKANVENASMIASKLYGSNLYDLGSRGLMHRIFRGNNDLGLGRPKFLSDQLFNKALLGNLYPSQEDRDDAGPGAGGSSSSGRAGANDPWREIRTLGAELNRQYTELGHLLARNLVDAYNAGLAAAGNGAVAAGYGGALAAYNPVTPNLSAILRSVSGVIRGAGAAALKTELANIYVLAARVELFGILRKIDQLLTKLSRVNIRPLTSNSARSLQAQLMLPAVPAARVPVPLGAITPSAANINWADPDAVAGEWTPAAIVTVADAYTDPARVGAFPDISAAIDGGTVILAITLYFLGMTVAGSVHRVGDMKWGSRSWADNLLAMILRTSVENTGNPAESGEGWLVKTEEPSLTYMSQFPNPLIPPALNTDPLVAKVSLSIKEAACLEQAGRSRFDTRFVRNLVFVTGALRLVRLKLNREFVHSRKVVVEDRLSVAPGVTEFGQDPYGPNEVFGAKLGRYAQFEDSDDIGLV